MIQNEVTERGAVTKGKGQKSFTKRITGECFQWKANGSCFKEILEVFHIRPRDIRGRSEEHRSMLSFKGEQEGKVMTVEIVQCPRHITMLRVWELILKVA